jgi:hypothetical protein
MPDATMMVDTGPVMMQLSAPTFNPPTGATLALGGTVTIIAPAMPATFTAMGGQVLYTLDGTVPTSGGASTKVYSGPIQITTAGTTTINAIATLAGWTTSNIATATYTVSIDGGKAVLFNPPSTSQSNDFLVSLSDGPGATICFTTDGHTTPTCDGAAKCTGTSQTYNAGAGLGAAGSVTINGNVTDASGNVSVQAIACVAGAAPTPVVTQQYTLKAANPTMQGPVPSTMLAFNAAGYAPTMSGSTTGSALRYTLDGSTPTCSTGVLLANPIGSATGVNPGALPVTKNVVIKGIACKSGYAPSEAVTFTYGINLAPLGFFDHGTTTTAATGTYDRAFSIDFDPTADTYTAGATIANQLYACYSTTATAPTCGATANVCSSGTMAKVGTTPTAVAIGATGTTLTVVACSPTFNASVAASATYTLKLDPPGLNPPACPQPAPATGTQSCTIAGSGAPNTSFQIPVTPPTFNVEQFYGKPPSSGGGQVAYGFICASKTATPVCGNNGCTTGSSIAPAAGQGFIGPYTGGGAVAQVPVSNGGVTIAAMDTWKFVGCPATGTSFLPSDPTTVTFSGPGQALAPSILPAGGTFNKQLATGQILNTDKFATKVCYAIGTVAAPPTDPACSGPTTCSSGLPAGAAANVTASGSATVLSLGLTSGGTGYTSAPTVTVDPPSGTGTQAVFTAALGFGLGSIAVTNGGSGCPPTPTVDITGGGGTGATATATVSGATNAVTAITVTAAGSGYTSAPTITIHSAACGANFAATASLTATGSVLPTFTLGSHGSGYAAIPNVTFTGGGGSGATAVALVDDAFALPAQQTDTVLVKAVACSASGSLPTSPVSSQSLNFKIATPDIMDGTTNLDNGGSILPGDTLTFSTTSDFSTSMSICLTTDGSTPTCTCTPGTYVKQIGPLAGTPFSASLVQGSTLPAFAPSTNTIKAIACDTTGTTQQASDVRSAALTLTIQTPVFTPPGGTFQNTLTGATAVTLSSAGSTVICYTTTLGATPTCSAGLCTGGTNTYSAGAKIQVTTDGTDLKAIACSATAMSAPTADNTYHFSVSPIVLNNNPGSTCGTPGTPNVEVGLDCATSVLNPPGVCSTATTTATGPTKAATVCYSTDGTPVNNCLGGGTIVCGTSGAGGTTVQTATLSASATVKAMACLAGFNSSSASLPVSFTPYTFTPIIDGSLADWQATATAAATAAATFQTTGAIVGANYVQPFVPTAGYFAYDSANYYFAYQGNTAPLATTYVTVYVGDGGTTGGTTTPIPTDLCVLGPGAGTPVLPTGINAKYAFTWPTDNSAAPTTYVYNSGTATWVATAFTVTVGYGAAGSKNVEFSVPAASVGSITTPTVAGALVTFHGQTNCSAANPVATTDTWPQTTTIANKASFGFIYKDNKASCQVPNTSIVP